MLNRIVTSFTTRVLHSRTDVVPVAIATSTFFCPICCRHLHVLGEESETLWYLFTECLLSSFSFEVSLKWPSMMDVENVEKHKRSSD